MKSLLKPKLFSLDNKSFLWPDHVFSSCCYRQCVVWHTWYNVNVHYCLISYPTLKFSFQECISTLTEETKDDLIKRMCEKHPQFVFDVLIGSTQEQGGYHTDPRGPSMSHHLPGADVHTAGKCQAGQKKCVVIKRHTKPFEMPCDSNLFKYLEEITEKIQPLLTTREQVVALAQ